MADVRIEVVTYEQSRLAYFKELQSRQKKRFEQFEKSSALKELPPQERHNQLSQMGEVLQYYDDIVKMLETEVVPKIEGTWIWTENGTEDYEQYWLCSCCRNKSYWKSKFCEECGAKMKGGNEQ